MLDLTVGLAPAMHILVELVDRIDRQALQGSCLRVLVCRAAVSLADGRLQYVSRVIWPHDTYL